MGKIKINDDYSIERDVSCWILYISSDGISRKTKEKIRTTREIYPSTLMGCFDTIIDMNVGNAESLTEMRQLILDSRNDILTLLKGVDIGGCPRGCKGLEKKSRRSKGEPERNEDDDTDENEGIKGKVQVEGSKGSGKVDKNRRKRTRKNGR